jgi:choline dehydrogenase
VYDYVIVGAGSAGCVLANRLSAHPETRVLLLEAGPSDGTMAVRVPAAFSKLFKTERDWNYTTDAEPALAHRALYWPRGKMLGGCSSINAQMHVRGNAHDFDEWADNGAPGWSFADVLPYFKKMEDSARGPSELRATGGPLAIAELREVNRVTHAFVRAAQEAGIEHCADVNGARQDGVDYTQVTQRRGARCSSASAYLAPARRRPNLTVVTGARVTRIVFDGVRAAGVEFVRYGSTETARAAREVVLSAGAVNSPQLLLLSGVGQAAQLQRFGLGVVADSPGVGENLQDHLACGLVMHATQPVTLVSAESKWNLLRYLLFRRGMLASNVAEACAFVRSSPRAPAPDLEILFAPVPFLEHGQRRPPGHGFTIASILLQPKSRGRISLRSGSPFDSPLIQPCYLSDPEGEDLEVMRRGMRLAQRVVDAPSLAAFASAPMLPDRRLEDDADIDAFIRATSETLYHPVGTCRMGSDDAAVVDSMLRVRGVERLRVVDASVMPVIVRGHTNAPTVMIAERAADLILGKIPVVAVGGRYLPAARIRTRGAASR